MDPSGRRAGAAATVGALEDQGSATVRKEKWTGKSRNSAGSVLAEPGGEPLAQDSALAGGGGSPDALRGEAGVRQGPLQAGGGNGAAPAGSTIRRAARVLPERGLILRVHGRGTFVANPVPPEGDRKPDPS